MNERHHIDTNRMGALLDVLSVLPDQHHDHLVSINASLGLPHSGESRVTSDAMCTIWPAMGRNGITKSDALHVVQSLSSVLCIGPIQDNITNPAAQAHTIIAGHLSAGAQDVLVSENDKHSRIPSTCTHAAFMLYLFDEHWIVLYVGDVHAEKRRYTALEPIL